MTLKPKYQVDTMSNPSNPQHDLEDLLYGFMLLRRTAEELKGEEYMKYWFNATISTLGQLSTSVKPKVVDFLYFRKLRNRTIHFTSTLIGVSNPDKRENTKAIIAGVDEILKRLADANHRNTN